MAKHRNAIRYMESKHRICKIVVKPQSSIRRDAGPNSLHAENFSSCTFVSFADQSFLLNRVRYCNIVSKIPLVSRIRLAGFPSECNVSCLLIGDGDGSGSWRAGRLPHWFCDSRCTEMNRDGGNSEILGLDEEEKRSVAISFVESLGKTIKDGAYSSRRFGLGIASSVGRNDGGNASLPLATRCPLWLNRPPR